MARLYGPGPGDPPALIATGDLAGLSTNDVEDRPVGELVGTLSEQRTGLIRYLDVEIRSAAKHVLVPIGHARIDQTAVPPRVRLRAATQEDLVSVPAFARETPLDTAYQERVMRVHGRLFYGSRYYAHPAYDHRLGTVPGPGSGARAPAEDGTGLRPLTELQGRSYPRLSRLIGLDVRSRDGERIGRVRDLIIESGVARERYVVLQLEDPDRSAVIPVGYVEADVEAGRVRTPAFTAEDIRLLPPYEPPLTREAENRIHAAIEGRLSGPRYFERVDFRAPAGEVSRPSAE
ncbi:MAG: PRC-barrel domain-containing protein [Gemmatimonadota bacterium]|jgi:sporulation protein YlmC with PRC-barrel domain